MPDQKLQPAIGRSKRCECDNRKCDGKLNQLREYVGYPTQGIDGKHTFVSAWSELSLHVDEDQLVRWVNELAVLKERQRFQHQKSKARRDALIAAANEMLDPDELKEIEAQAKLRAEGKMK